ncbi:phosphoribosylglycinamide formyltransferase [Haliovirga abyssi]|uniref:Phosphoribosylglycinamide formyltransferase n=1 Tax=Haliovirga abyssi TaxID=2996794 RepID=A0AAU9DWA7_9FUSO|nr:phosphoribosylglycinamide formyltransferase [Haliovirga abyssi]BDU50551.1 phosphoribosylglycinamide formyltransferase [Haliovirga abyssi]
MKIGVLISGSGTNLQAIIDSITQGIIKKSTIEVVVSNVKSAYGLERAKQAGIKAIYINSKEYNSREEYDKKIVEILKENGVELIILAGYLKWITPYFVNQYKNKILNIHPSLLPSFKGLHAIEKAYEYGVKMTGVTVHFVDESEDGGAIILQEGIRLDEGISLEKLEEQIHKVEHKLYPKAIEKFVTGKIKLEGRKVIVEK